MYRNELYPKIFVEVKKHSGDSFEKIVIQCTAATQGVLDKKNEKIFEDNTFVGSNFYIIAVRGTQIAFYEKIHFPSGFNHSVPHSNGVIPFALHSDELRGHSTPNVLQTLQDRIRTASAKNDKDTFKFKDNLKRANSQVRNDSEHCTLSLVRDAKLVHDIFSYINSNIARGCYQCNYEV